MPDGVTVRGLAYSDGQLVVGVKDATTSVLTDYLIAPADGSGDWQPLSYGGQQVQSRGQAAPFYSAGTVIATADTGSCPTWQVDRPGGQQSIASCAAPRLGRRGELSQALTSMQPMRWTTTDSAGTTVRESDGAVGMDGGTAWDVALGADGPMVQGFTATGTTAAVRLPSECASARPAVVDASGRWALAECGSEELLIDTSGAFSPWMLQGSWRLGRDFLYREAGGAIEVMGLDVGHSVSSYPLPQDESPLAYAAGDVSGASIAYLVRASSGAITAHVVDPNLPAVASASDDTTAPAVDATGGSTAQVAAVPGGTRLDFTWSGHDPGHSQPVSFDVEKQDSRRPGDGWVRLDTDTFATSQSVTVENPESTICVRVRARDWVGNVSGWRSRCVYVDGEAPQTVVGNTSPFVFAPVIGPASFRFRFTATDDGTGPLTHDFQVRTAAWGRPLGAWTSTRARLAQSSSSTLVHLAAGSEACVRSRAHDPAGHVGPWSPQYCAVATLDDRAFGAHHARRVHVRSASRNGVTVLKGAARLTRGGASGRLVLVRARASDRCPRVTFAGRLLGGGAECAIGPAGGGYLWFELWAPRELHGSLVISAARGTTARVDAVAVMR